jgi:Zinc carboxypeptidase
MRRGCRWPAFFCLALVCAVLLPAAGARAAIEPPWCGTPTPDATGSLPDGTQPGDPPGSFPHIPYYAIGCTLDRIQSQSNGRMEVEVIGQSALGRDMYGITINALDTTQQRKDFHNWQEVRRVALSDPARGQSLVRAAGADIKVPIFIQAGIHGNEQEGVDASMRIIERLATTPYGEDPAVDAALDHTIMVFNIVQNPDGRIAATRANGNGFDLNRDYLTQSQSETIASVKLMQKWLAPEVLDQHGYVNPTLIEATTKPHNPSIEYDNWLKWNQPRIDANEAAMNAAGFQVTRPVNDWCEDGNPPPAGSTTCANGQPPGPAEAESWDDWGPFYTAMFAQHIGLDSSTVEMCNNAACGGRLGSRQAQSIVALSTIAFVIDHRGDMLFDMLENYRRGVVNAPRPECCPPPFDVDNNWMLEYPEAYVIPKGAGQRSNPEANRLVEWLLFNGIQVTELKQDYAFGGQTFQRGSYVVPMAQARRGLADTALRIGVDVSPRISILYAPPAAWSHGYLWGADVVTIDRGAAFTPQTNVVTKPNQIIEGGVEPGQADRYALEIDSPTAVRTLNRLVGDGLPADVALSSFTGANGATVPAGTALFGADPATKNALAETGRATGLQFVRVASSALPALEPIERVPRIAVLTGAVNQDVWVLRNLGFQADPISTAAINSAATDPLAGYDVIFNTANYPANTPANATVRSRLAAFFANGGGYLGALTNGAAFLTNGGQVAGLTAANRSGNGRSGIVYWDNEGGAASPITGTYPSRDTAIMDPPTWFTGVPATFSVDGRLPQTGFFAAGLWSLDAQSATAPGAPVIAHGENTAGTARLTVFAMNPLYRADPEREWPMVGSAAYWADR